MTARLPSLNGLRAFEAAARHLSFTQAASELNVTQTAISHQIKRLEEELGVRLFIRQNRSLALTQQAQEYLPGIRAAFNDLRLATDRLLRKDDDHVLTVSTLASLAAKWLLPRLTDFQEQHPGIDVRITTSTSLVDFQRDDVDAAIRYGRGQWPGLRADWLMAVCVTFSSDAAWVKLRCRAAASKARNPFSDGSLAVIPRSPNA